MLNRVADQVDSIVQLEFIQGVLHVVLDSSVGEHQALGNLPIRKTGADHAQDLRLPLGEARRVGRSALRERRPGGGIR